MASVHVVFTTSDASAGGSLIPVAQAHGYREVYLDSEGVSNFGAPDRPGAGYVAVVTCDSGPAWVRFGQSPGEAEDLVKTSNWWLVLEGQTREFSVNAGDFIELADD